MTAKSDQDQAHSATETALPPHPTLHDYYARDSQRPAFINGLFDASARHYDRISSLMSFGTDKAYRRRVLLETGLKPGMKMLDVACGTGMVSGPANDIVGASGRIVGLDPSPGMLQQAVRAGRLTQPVQGRAEHLPFPDNYFDMLTMGFALRHVADLITTFGEYKRVIKPGSKALILEITPPASRSGYLLFKFYLKHVIPGMTRLSTFNPDAHSLMSYFWDTVEYCVPPQTILDALNQVGFVEVKRKVQIGVFSEYTAIKS